MDFIIRYINITVIQLVDTDDLCILLMLMDISTIAYEGNTTYVSLSKCCKLYQVNCLYAKYQNFLNKANGKHDTYLFSSSDTSPPT